ncbi:MAG: pyridoxal-phosphate dependent enzyme [Pseudomonadota bacterium]
MLDQPILFDPALPKAVMPRLAAYAATPFVRHQTAGREVWIKDETARFGLGAFKALGGVYAVATLLSRATGIADPLSAEARKAAQAITFVCASAGNHGMAVAAGAKLFGAKSRVHISDTVSETFADRLRGQGAEVARSGATYEDSIAAAIEDAATTGAHHLADLSWEGYDEPPRLVMEGYTLMAEEMRAELEAHGNWPTHVYLQAGVGGLAGAVAYMIRQNWQVQPEITVVEPEAAPCLKATVEAGQMTTVKGPISAMGRLDCKTASALAFEVLRKTADRFVTVSEEEAARAVDQAETLGFDTTPSGAAGLAAMAREPADGRALCIISEGAF